MPTWHPGLIDAIRQGSRGAIHRELQGKSLQDTVEAITFTGPERIGNVFATYPVNLASRATSGPITAGVVNVSYVCALILRHWGVPIAPSQTPPPSVSVDAAIRAVGDLRAAAPRAGPIISEIASPASRILPEPAANPPRLSYADYVASAQRLGAEVAAVQAVASVESSGDGFDASGRPKILFEAHHFKVLNRTRSRLRFDVTHPHLSNDYRPGMRYRSWNQWTRMFEALLLDPAAAIEASSWGKFQGLGRYQTAWPTPFEYARNMFVSERNHLIAFEAYVRDKGLVSALQRRDFLTFARGYNGADQQGYDGRMRRAYESFRRAAR
jgi:hypothetical protein